MMDEETGGGIIRDQPQTVDFMSSPLPLSFRDPRTDEDP